MISEPSVYHNDVSGLRTLWDTLPRTISFRLLVTKHRALIDKTSVEVKRRKKGSMQAKYLEHLAPLPSFSAPWGLSPTRDSARCHTIGDNEVK